MNILKNTNEQNNLYITASSLYVHNAVHVKSETNQNVGTIIKDYFYLFHIVSGKGIYKSGGKNYSLAKGDSFLIYPGTEVIYSADPEMPWEYYMIGFSGKGIETMLEYTDFTKESPVLTFNFDERLALVMKKVCNVDRTEVFSNIDLTGLMFSVFSVLMNSSVHARRLSKDSDFYINKAVEYIKFNYANQITSELIADYIGISKINLNKIFTEKCKMTTKEFITAYRIDRACELMENQSVSVQTASCSVGYNDSLYFTKVFRKIKGISPAQYQKKKNFFNALVK